MLSVILPSYNEEAMILTAAKTISEILKSADIGYELIFVDDGSRDRTWELINEASDADENVTGLHFSRNFGKEAAIFAGLEAANGDACVILDCDLQHPPKKIVEMYRLWQDGYEVIEGVKSDRGSETFAHRAAANTFYKLISRMTGFDMGASSDFKLLDRKVVDALNRMPERNTFFRALSYWTGFKTTTVSYEVQERTAGESKWSTWSLAKYALKNIASFSSAPLQIVTGCGIVMLVIALVFGIIALCQKIAGTALGGFTTIILLQLITGSMIMISLGIIGFYISRIYEEIKGRPRYIVSQKCGKK